MENTKTISQDNPSRYRGWRQLRGCGTLFYWNEHITGVGVNITVHLFMPENIYIFFSNSRNRPLLTGVCMLTYRRLPVRFPRSACPPLRPGQAASAPVSRNQGSQNSGPHFVSDFRSYLKQSISSLIEMLQDMNNLTAVPMKNSVILAVLPCNTLDI